MVNGTTVRLKCTFTSPQPVSLQSVAVSWNFRPLNSAQDESVCSSCVSFLSLFWGGGGGFNAAAAAAAAAVLLSCSLKVKHVFSDSFQVFYFHELAYPPQQGRFQGHAEWSGNILNQDASVTLNNVLPTFNGTYICQVRNPPDVHGSNGEIVLRVVNKGQEKCWGNFESCAPPPFVCLLNTSAVIQL